MGGIFYLCHLSPKFSVLMSIYSNDVLNYLSVFLLKRADFSASLEMTSKFNMSPRPKRRLARLKAGVCGTATWHRLVINESQAKFMKYLIVGLGNIGPEYEVTRHNIGFLTLDRLADQKDAKFEMSRLAYHADFKFKGRSIHLIKPTTYMNLSGKAVKYWMNELKVPVENVLVIVDDIAIPFGKLRMRAKGSSAGHNGLKNIEQLIGGQHYPRLKFGVGDDFAKGRQVDYVLSPFTQSEFDELPFIMDKAIDMTLGFCTIGIARTMSQFNS